MLRARFVPLIRASRHQSWETRNNSRVGVAPRIARRMLASFSPTRLTTRHTCRLGQTFRGGKQTEVGGDDLKRRSCVTTPSHARKVLFPFTQPRICGRGSRRWPVSLMRGGAETGYWRMLCRCDFVTDGKYVGSPENGHRKGGFSRLRLFGTRSIL